MTATQLAQRIGGVDDVLIPQLLDPPKQKKRQNLRLVLLIAAALAVLLALCGFVIYKVHPNSDLWIQNPSSDPVEVVRSAIENQAQKDYTYTVRIDEITIHEAETERVIKMYMGSDFAATRGWSDEYLLNHFVVVRAKYYVEYDTTKVWYDIGDIDKFFYLVENPKTGEWTITDNTTNEVPKIYD